MSKRNINFDGKKIKRSEFYKNKNVTEIDKIDVNKTLVSKEEPCRTKNSFKYFMGYNDNDVIRPLCMRLQQTTGYVRKFEDNTTMSFKNSYKELLKKYNQIWQKVKRLLNVKFDSEPVYGDSDKCIKTKTKIYGGSAITNFQKKKHQKEMYHASVYR